MLFFMSIVCADFLILYNMSDLPGNVLMSLTIYNSFEAAGIILSPFIAQYLNVKLGVSVACLLISGVVYLQKFCSPNETYNLVLICTIAFILGMNQNYAIMLNNELIDFKFRFLSFEFNYCMAYCFTMVAPLMAIAPEP